MKREVAKDPWEPRLKQIHLDDNTNTKGKTLAWVMRLYGVKDSFLNPKTNAVSDNYGTIVLKSLWWPGSYTFYNNQRTLSIYVGNGQKFEEQTYYPVNPPVMRTDRQERKCWDEPNPTQEWLDYVEAQNKANEQQQEDD